MKSSIKIFQDKKLENGLLPTIAPLGSRAIFVNVGDIMELGTGTHKFTLYVKH